MFHSNPNYIPPTIVWTPVLSFTTPGDLSVTYSLRSAHYVRIGNFISANFVIVTSAFTYSTAAGDMVIDGLPVKTSAHADYRCYSSLLFQGINKASYQSVYGVLINDTSRLLIYACGMGQPSVSVTTADSPSGGTVILGGTFNYATVS